MAGLIPFNRKRSDLMNVGFNDFSNMLDDFFADSWPMKRSLVGDTFKIDILDNEREYTIQAELPGLQKEDIDIVLNDGKLILSANKDDITEENDKNYIHRERRYSSMSRTILLADADQNSNKIDAKLDKGILEIKVPKKEKIDNTKKIEIK